MKQILCGNHDDEMTLCECSVNSVSNSVNKRRKFLLKKWDRYTSDRLGPTETLASFKSLREGDPC